MNPTSIHEDVDSIPGPAQRGRRSGIAMRCGVGHRHSSDPPCFSCGVGQQLRLQLDPCLGTSICCGCGPKKTEKKKKNRLGLEKTLWKPCSKTEKR